MLVNLIVFFCLVYCTSRLILIYVTDQLDVNLVVFFCLVVVYCTSILILIYVIDQLDVNLVVFFCLVVVYCTSILILIYVTGLLDVKGGSYEELLEYLEKLLNSELISLDLYWFLVAYLIYFFLSNTWRSRTQSRMFIVPQCLDENNGELRSAIIDLNDPLGINLMRLYHNEYRDTYVRLVTNPWLGRPYVAIVDPDPVVDTLYETPELYLQNHPEGYIDIATMRPRRNVWRRLIRSQDLIIETKDSELFVREVVYTRGRFITVSIECSLYYTRTYVV